VVADEVRKLAEQSSASSKQIGKLIQTIQQETEQTVLSMKEATDEMAEGISIVNVAKGSFEQIQDAVKLVTNQIGEVSTASQQLSAGTEQVVHSINTVTKIAEDAAAGSHNVSTAAEEQLASMQEVTASSSYLAKMAEELQSVISRFKL
jgi:methyl-accepting chemotaxis protein